MDMNLLGKFIVLNIVNVIVQTIKNLATIKANKYVAAIISAFTYGFHTIVLVYMVCDLPLATKVIVVALCNLIGVFFVKLLEEKSRKDKLWKIEITVPTQYIKEVDEIPVAHSYVKLSDKHTLFNFYCPTQQESSHVKALVKKYNVKYCALESKTLL